MLKKIAINIVLLFFIIILIEGISLLIATSSNDYWHKDKTFIERLKFNLKEYCNTPDVFEEEYKRAEHLMRKPQGENYKNKNSIVLMGCSITHGVQLKDEDTLGYNLSKLTKRPVYNVAFWGWGIQQTLRLIQNGTFFQKVKTKPDYVIYTYIPDHKKRLWFYQEFFYNSKMFVRYQIKSDGTLKEVKHDKFPFYYRFYTVKLIQKLIEKQNTNNYKKSSDLFFKIFQEIQSSVTQKYPDVKFIVLLYPLVGFSETEISSTDEYFTDYEQEELKKMNVQVVNIEQLLGKSYKPDEYKLDPYHPNGKFWKEVLPKVIETTGM